MIDYKKLVLLSLILISFTGLCFGDNLSLPDKVRKGVLDNGLTYYIVQNEYPAGGIEFALVLPFGSAVESKKEEGVAHFIEHLAFDGMNKFPGKDIVEYWESKGLKFGSDINAFTGYDRTIYQISYVRYGDYKHFTDTTLAAFSEILSGLQFSDDAIERERDIILQEQRTYNISDDFYSAKIGKSIHTSHIPIGSESAILKIDKNVIRGFYDKWYKPSLASVIVVGDLEPETVEKYIIKNLGDLPKQPSVLLPEWDIVYDNELKINMMVDSLRTDHSADLIFSHNSNTKKGLRSAFDKEILDGIVSMLNARMNYRKHGVTFSNTWYLADTEHFSIEFSASDKSGLLKDVSYISSELYSILRNGISEEELNTIRFRDNFYGWSAYTSSTSWRDELIEKIVLGEPKILTEGDSLFLRQMLDTVSVATIQQSLGNIVDFSGKGAMLNYICPSSTGCNITVSEFDSAWVAGSKIDVPMPEKMAYKSETEEFVLPEFLSEDIHDKRKKHIAHRYFPKQGLDVYYYDNGMELWMKHIDSEAVRLVTLGERGLDAISMDDFHKLESTAAYMEMGGVEGIEDSDYQDIMLNTDISMNIALGNHWHGLMATSPTKYMRELVNLAYLKSIKPELRYRDFEESKSEEINSFGRESYLSRALSRDVSRQMSMALDSLVGNFEIFSDRQKTMDDIKEMNLDSIASFYKYLYSLPQDLKIIVCGDIDKKKILDAVEHSFAHLPAVDSVTSHYNTFALSDSMVERKFDGEYPGQTVVELALAGNYTPSLRNNLIIKLMRDALQARLIQTVREKEGLVYSPYVSLFIKGVPQEIYYFQLSLACQSGRYNELIRTLNLIIRDLSANSIPEEELERYKNSFLLTKSQVLAPDALNAWMDNFIRMIKNGETAEDYENYEEFLKDIDTEDIRLGFSRYIDFEKRIELKSYYE